MKVLGLDLSLRGCGMVALPTDWSGDWNRVARHTFGEPLPKDAPDPMRIGRLTRIAATIVDFARRHEVTHVVAEGYSFTSVHGHAHSLGEVGGVVRHQLAEKLGLVAYSVPSASARKLLMGNLPRKDVKTAVRVFLTTIGLPPSWSMDEGDAFVVANFESSNLGGFAYVTAPAVVEKRPRKRAA